MLTKGLALKSKLTAARVRELFHYDPDTGVLTRRVSVGGGNYAGDVAGGKTPYGYLQVWVDGYMYLVHRIIWRHVTGAWPDPFIDHRDGDGINNRWSNLREATHAQNHQNLAIRATNKSGFPGVSWDASRGKWKAQITLNRRNRCIGRFDSPEAAGQAYRAEKARLHTFNPQIRTGGAC